jgi:hypothetical protein
LIVLISVGSHPHAFNEELRIDSERIVKDGFVLHALPGDITHGEKAKFLHAFCDPFPNAPEVCEGFVAP